VALWFHQNRTVVLQFHFPAPQVEPEPERCSGRSRGWLMPGFAFVRVEPYRVNEKKISSIYYVYTLSSLSLTITNQRMGSSWVDVSRKIPSSEVSVERGGTGLKTAPEADLWTFGSGSTWGAGEVELRNHRSVLVEPESYIPWTGISLKRW